jgi:hypothetical protein
MSTQNIEKKLYPSQINSKTISARIPVQDYVKFLEDSLSKGISLNDFLLMKIYSKSKIGNDNNSTIEINKEDLKNLEYDYNFLLKFYKQEFENDVWIISKETILELLSDLYNNTTQLQNYYNSLSNKKASLSDVKTQLTVLIKNKFTDIEDQQEYRKELHKLLRELE